jgi:purine catabolism regulator
MSGCRLPHALVQFATRDQLDAARRDAEPLLDEVSRSYPHARLRIGPVPRALDDIARSLNATRGTLAIREAAAERGLIDARDFATVRLLEAIDAEIAVGQFLETLLAYTTNWGSKTDSARKLAIQRQTLYQRLEKVFGAIGPLEPGSP